MGVFTELKNFEASRSRKEKFFFIERLKPTIRVEYRIGYYGRHLLTEIEDLEPLIPQRE